MPKTQKSNKEDNSQHPTVSLTGKLVHGKKVHKDKVEDVSNINNLINAARIVESSNTKVGKGKSRKKSSSSKAHKTVKHPVSGLKSIKKTTQPKVAKINEEHETSSESDSDNQNELADLKKSVNYMMARIEKLEGSRKKKKRKTVPESKSQDSSTSEDEGDWDKVKPRKMPKVDKNIKENSPTADECRSDANAHLQTLHVPDTANIHSLNALSQFMQMNPAAYSNFLMQPNNLFPMFAAMNPQADASMTPNNYFTANAAIPNPNIIVTEGSQDREQFNFKTNLAKNDQKKEKKKTVEKDGNESDVSEVYGPTDLNPDLKIPNMAPYLPIGPIETPSFIKFVNDMTADDQSVQSTVISSTKRNAENAANATAGVPVFEGGGNNASLGGIPKFLRSTSTNSKRSVDTAHLQGILLNLFPNQVQLPVEKKPSLHHTSETFDEPAIDKALKTMIRKQGSRQPIQHSLEQEKKLLEEKAPNLGQMMMMKNNNNAKTGVAKILFNLFPSSNPESVSHNTIVAARTVPPLERIEQTTTKNSVVKVLNKHQQVEWIPKQDQLLNRTASEIKMCQRSQINPGEVTYTNMSQRKQSSRKKYTDNKVWLRQCPSKLYLQDQDGDT